MTTKELKNRMKFRKNKGFRVMEEIIVPIRANIVLQNDHVEIVHRACKECYKGKLLDSIAAKLKYIQNQVKHGHESVLEHSNVIMLIEMSTKNLDLLSDVIDGSKLFLDFEVEVVNDIAYILVGGSIAAFKRLIQRTKNITNPLIQAIMNQFYYLDKEYFYDFIERGILDESRFMDTELVKHEPSNPYELNPEFEKHSSIEVLNYDSLMELYHATGGIFKLHRLMKFVSITFYFKDMARIITQQLTRHRNGITQKSQRYVDESGAKCVNPIKINYQEYVSKAMSSLGLSEEEAKEKVDTLINLFEEKFAEVSAIYDELRSDNFVNKEDARYLLTNAVESSLYVTMSGTNAIHFCKMRVDSHAQKEIKLYAQPIEDMLIHVYGKQLSETNHKQALYDVIEPEYTLAAYFNEEEKVDEVLEEKEITVDDAYDSMVKSFDQKEYIE